MATKTSTTTSLSPNVASALCYIPFVGWLLGIVFFLVEKNSTVKWNAAQGALFGVSMIVLTWVLPFTIVLALLIPLVWLTWLIGGLLLLVRSYQGATVKLPLLGAWADTLVKKV